MAENNVGEMIKNALEGVRSVADSDTVLGEPINTNNGTVIIPVSKITVGLASGGLDYLPKSGDKDAQSKAAKTGAPCFGGGGGTGISVTPICFLVVKADGSVSTLNIDSPAPATGVVGAIDSISSFAEKAPDIISKFKDLFAKKKPESSLDDEELQKELDDLKAEVEAEVEKELSKEEAKKAKKAAKKAK